MSKGKRDFCSTCKQERWIYRSDGRCKPCAYSIGGCAKCRHNGKLYVDRLCYCCYQDRQNWKYIKIIEDNFVAKTEYNKYLFELYLIYIRRYRISYYHKIQSKKLADVLSQDPWSTINNWNDIYILSKKYWLLHDNGRGNGCAVKKIGFMLQELGVLKSKDEDYRYSLEQMLFRFKPPLYEIIKNYSDWMEKSGRAECTIINNLRDLRVFNSWLIKLNPSLSMLTTNQATVTRYLEDLSNNYHHSYTKDAYYSIRRFYNWVLYKKKIIFNPIQEIDFPNNLVRIVIAAEEDIKKLISFIKNKSSQPEEAFILTLILFFGLTTDYLLHATIDFSEDKTIINLKRRPTTQGRHYYNRDQTFIIPISPDWLKQLSLRFRFYWQKQYSKTTKTYPSNRLFLPRHGHYDRPIHQKTFIKRVYAATFKATGKKIPPKVLRQTCGHLHSKNGDASILSTLGWSPSFSFDYTWLPREIFSEKQTS